MRYDEFRDHLQNALRSGLFFHYAENDRGLVQLAERFRNGIDERSKSVADLARWIRYSPPLREQSPLSRGLRTKTKTRRQFIDDVVARLVGES